ncbi:hypothetical protein FRC10_005636 [Ceratobasidium sp. 414]|nr:hypothetical protein FRC10_005636 [Ceratobasidium sp. 414]
MHRLSTVLMLLVTVTFLLSLVAVVSICPVAADVIRIDCISDLVVLPRAICVCVRHVLPVRHQTLNVCRLTRTFDALSALAASSAWLIIVKTFEYLCQLLILSRSIGHFLLCMTFLAWLLVERVAEAVFHHTPPYLHSLCSFLWIISGEFDELQRTKVELTVILPVGCVYVVLCGAPILVLYCVVLDANPSLKPKQEPVLGTPYAVVRRRKLPRMLQERYERERAQALQREAKRQKTRLATLRPPNPPPIGLCEPPPTEINSHQTTKQYGAEPASPTPLVPTRETEVEPCDIAPPSPLSSLSFPSTTICSESAVSSASTNPLTPTSSCVPAGSPATPNTEYYGDSSPAEGATLMLAEDSEEFKSNGSSTADENGALGLVPTLSNSGNPDTPLVVEPEVIGANNASAVGSCLVSSPPTTTGSEADKLSQENSVENRAGLLDASDAVVKDIIATLEVAALIEAAVAELGSTLVNDIANPSLSETNQISTNEDETYIGSTASTAGSHTIQDDPNWDARLLENDNAGRSDTTVSPRLAQDAEAPSPMDMHMTTEQVDAVLELLDAELARIDGDLAGLDLELDLGASESADITLASPITSTTIPTVDADLQALDAMWELMGINSAEPGHIDIDLGAMELDLAAPMGETGDGGTGMDLEHSLYAPGEPIAILPGLNVAGLAQDIRVQMTDEECLAVLAQLCEEAIGATIDDMDLDETRATFTTASSEQQAQQPDPTTRSYTFSASEATGCDVSMSDEDCIAQLAELCKDITPAANPEVDLEQTLAMLSGFIGGTTEGTIAQDVAGPTYHLAPPRAGGAPESAGPCGCMRLEDVIDWTMVVDDAGEVDTSESEDGSEYLATPIVGPMEVDEALTISGWRCMETCEQETISLLDIHNGVWVRDSRK